MSYFYKSEHCITPTINPLADCRSQSLAGRVEPRGDGAGAEPPAFLDILRALEQKSSEGCATVFSCLQQRARERGVMGSWRNLGPRAASAAKRD